VAEANTTNHGLAGVYAASAALSAFFVYGLVHESRGLELEAIAGQQL